MEVDVLLSIAREDVSFEVVICDGVENFASIRASLGTLALYGTGRPEARIAGKSASRKGKF